ncbi:hypothetical protein A9317_02505 [Yersinia pestis]|nr:hypothetical protein A9317_02505 [Yersinia pestis]
MLIPIKPIHLTVIRMLIIRIGDYPYNLCQCKPLCISVARFLAFLAIARDRVKRGDKQGGHDIVMPDIKA